MTKGELFATYALPVIAAVITAVAGYVGAQLKGLCQKYIDDKTKENVARTCVKAVEQLYHDLSGPEKLKKAQEGVVEMLNEKGIPISELEMNLLIESVVSEFNYGFGKIDQTYQLKEAEEPVTEPAEYSEEDGASL